MGSDFLITTADERTWRKDQPVLFLGAWCMLYDRRSIWSKMDAQIVPYHWGDRKKLRQDYFYVRNLYEEILHELADQLNVLHGVNHSLRYWRILIGPWLRLFIEMLLDRWAMIQKAATEYTLSGVQILEQDRDQVLPNDMSDFYGMCVEDSWNESMYGTVLKKWTSVPVREVPLETTISSEKKQATVPPVQWLKHQLLCGVLAFSQMFVQENEAFFLATYLPAAQDLRLQGRLGQFPKRWRSIPAPKVPVDWARRQWQIGPSGLKDFPAFVRTMIPCQIPALYLEGYSVMQELCRSLSWPKKPRVIFTSNSFFADDVFKAWAAEKVENGAPLVIGQHGGNYGIGLWESLEEHQCAISDCWLSWGWQDDKCPNIQPACNLKLVGHALSWDPAGFALMVEMTIPRYSYRMYSMPVAGQWLSYFEDQCRFVDALPEKIRKSLIVRLQQQDYQWGQQQRWEDRYPDLRLDEGRASILTLMKRSRICVSTHNATTFLESMALNIPTIIFWDPQYYEFRDSAAPYFERLKSVGIFHVTPESAAQQLSEVWEDIGAWWNSKPVQEVRQGFCDSYSRMPENALNEIEQIFRKMINN